MKLIVSISRFNDCGQAACSLELDLEPLRSTGPAEKTDREKLRERITKAYALCDQSVVEQLGRMSEPVPIRERHPKLPEELAAIIHRALAKQPKDRFRNVQEFRKALVPFRKG